MKLDPLVPRIARRFQASEIFHENSVRLNEVEKLRRKLSRLGGQFKLDEQYEPTNAEVVVPKLLATLKEISQRIDAVYGSLKSFYGEAHPETSDGEYMKRALAKRLDDVERVVTRIHALLKDPVAYMKASGTSYTTNLESPINLAGHVNQLSYEGFTSARASCTIAASLFSLRPKNLL
jgi:hypothetical protein